MITRATLLAPLVLALGAAGVAAQDIGGPLPETELENLTLTQATSFDDYMGRAVLIEFFAYW